MPNVAEWQTTLLDLKATRHAKAVQSFFTTTVAPVCETMSAQLGNLEASTGQDAAWHELRITQLVSRQSFALMIGSLWERAFAEHLLDLVRTTLTGPAGEEQLEKLASQVRTGRWKNYKKVFQAMRGFEMEALPMFEELHTLHLLCSAIRHGEGGSAEALQQKASDLFMEETEFRDIWDYWLESVEKHSIAKLDPTMEHLERFRDAVIGYWQLVARAGYREFPCTKDDA